jgi:hypothetical protein
LPLSNYPLTCDADIFEAVVQGQVRAQREALAPIIVICFSKGITMKRYLISVVLVASFVVPGWAQQNRGKLDAPGKVAFGTSYEQAKAALGADAEAYEPDPPEAGVKALSCDKCAPLPDVEGFTLYFDDKAGLVRLEAFAVAGQFKSVDECQKADTSMMPKLIESYGKPDSITKSSDSRVASFKFSDGAVVQHLTKNLGPDKTCTYTVIYKGAAASR